MTAPTSRTIEARDRRGTHHAEIVVLTRDASGPGATGVFYNDLGLLDDFSDADFDARFRALDPAALAAEFSADAVWMNGPRRALMDGVTGEAFDGGRVTSVGGIPMLNYGTVRVPDLDLFLGAHRPPYTELTIGRTTQWVFDRGREVHELVDPAGRVYVMQSCSQHVDPENTPDRLATLGDRLELPEGWRYRTRVLDDDLVVRAEAGVRDAHIVFDELEDNYQRVDS